MTKKIEIGYLCRKGHFQLDGDPDGDACGTKRVASVYVESDEPHWDANLGEYVQEALDSYNRKLEFWREG